ncbi:hypothetical protein BA895_10580 [Humibacillus sp. DSM 29435]|uniref:ABC transporter substrate-binding protein n=1 Tax=Humibacillus sp. DSM 29435 TaxID=1869167 RepID=UPI000872B60F|nr:ABC transporter substrate-binding protein [Humibacillus sp. DSM 29435]OFE14401.1 hypothetical protein BA895_10580 [Humibacillus sp. DSM 29435]
MSHQRLALIVAALGSLLLTSCGAVVQKDAPAAAGATATSTAKFHALLPDAIKTSGTIRAASGGTYAPMHYFDIDGKTIIGVERDLADALEKRLGVKIELVSTNFDGILAGLEANRFDTALVTMGDYEKRRTKMDFVDYGQTGTGISVAGGNPLGIKTMDDLCGKRVTAVRGYSYEADLKAQSTKCTEAGKAAVNVLVFTDDATANNAIVTGRSDAQLGDAVVIAYAAQKSKGKVVMLEQQLQPSVIGMPVLKTNPALRDALQKALQDVMDSGDYQPIWKKWNLPSSAIDKAMINANP